MVTEATAANVDAIDGDLKTVDLIGRRRFRSRHGDGIRGRAGFRYHGRVRLDGVGSGGAPGIVTVTSAGGGYKGLAGICVDVKRIGAARLHFVPSVAGDISHVEAQTSGIVKNIVTP